MYGITNNINNNVAFSSRRSHHASKNLKQATRFIREKCNDQFKHEGICDYPALLVGQTKTADGTTARIFIGQDVVEVYPPRYTKEVIKKFFDTVRKFQTKGKY